MFKSLGLVGVIPRVILFMIIHARALQSLRAAWNQIETGF